MVDYKISSPLQFKPDHSDFFKHVFNCPTSKREHKTFFSVLILLITIYK